VFVKTMEICACAPVWDAAVPVNHADGEHKELCKKYLQKIDADGKPKQKAALRTRV
jgi:hypothetical protein